MHGMHAQPVYNIRVNGEKKSESCTAQLATGSCPVAQVAGGFAFGPRLGQLACRFQKCRGNLYMFGLCCELHHLCIDGSRMLPF